MIKVENIQTFGWEAAIRKLYNGKGVKFNKSHSYESYVVINGKFVSCGTYDTKEKAQEMAIIARIDLFKENIILHDENPAEIVETVEKGYFASPKGNIYNRYGKPMIGGIDRCGYRHVILNKKNKNVHRIIAETFISNPNNLPCVNHKDGNKLNNQISNLEWCSYSQNTKHAYQIGLEKKQCGEHHHAHKLTEKEIKYIRQNYIKRDKEFSASALAIKFNVDRSTIQSIIKHKTWKEPV